MNVTLENKVVVVTGASSGIGAALVEAFARNGASVVVHYNTKVNEGNSVFKKIMMYGTDCMLLNANLTDEKQVKMFCKKVVEHYGRVDILINNAGVCKDSLLPMMSENTWKYVIDTNLSASFYCCKHFSKTMIRHNAGKIINIASYKGVVGCNGQANYSASKAGMIGLSKTIAKELSVFNISVNVVCPGFISTPLNSNKPQKMNKAVNQSLLPIEDNLDTLVHTILFIGSDCFKGVTGQVFHIDSRMV